MSQLIVYIAGLSENLLDIKVFCLNPHRTYHKKKMHILRLLLLTLYGKYRSRGGSSDLYCVYIRIVGDNLTEKLIGN